MRTTTTRTQIFFALAVSTAVHCGGPDIAVDVDIQAVVPGPSWTCTQVDAYGPTGGCPDCFELCARLATDTKLELGVNLLDTLEVEVCGADIVVKQAEDLLFDGAMDISTLSTGTEGFTEATPEVVDGGEGELVIDGQVLTSTTCS